MDIVGLLDPSDGGNFLTKRRFVEELRKIVLKEFGYDSIDDLLSYSGTIFGVISPTVNGVSNKEIEDLISNIGLVTLIQNTDNNTYVVRIDDPGSLSEVYDNVSNGKFDVSFFKIDSSSGSGSSFTINKPSIVGLNGLTLEGSSFGTSSVATPSHDSSDWEIASDASFTNLIVNNYGDTTNLTTLSLDTSIIDLGVTYYARVRYHSGATVSDWSDGFTFTITDSIIKPSIISVDNGREVTASAFSTNSGYGFPHDSSDWEVALDAGFTNIAYSSYSDNIHLTEIVLIGLTQNTDYYLRVRYRSGNIVSAWSDAYSFNSLVYYPTPILLYPSSNDTFPYNNRVISHYPDGYNVIVDKYFGDPSVSRLHFNIKTSTDNGATWNVLGGGYRNYNPTGLYNFPLNLQHGEVKLYNIQLRWYGATGYTPWTDNIVLVNTTNDLISGASVNYLNYDNSLYPNFPDSVKDVYRYFMEPTLVSGSVEAIQHQFTRDRSFTSVDIDYTYNGTDYSDPLFNLYTSPHHQVRIYNTLLKNVFVDEDGNGHNDPIYYRSRVKVDGVWQRWSVLLYTQRTGTTFINQPTFQIPTEGAIFNKNILRLFWNQDRYIATSNRPYHMKIAGYEYVIGTSVDVNGDITNIIEHEYLKPGEPDSVSNNGSLSDITFNIAPSQFSPNTTYYIKARVIYDYCLDTPSQYNAIQPYDNSKIYHRGPWSPVRSFSTDSSFTSFSPIDDFMIFGEDNELGIPQNVSFFSKKVSIGLPTGTYSNDARKRILETLIYDSNDNLILGKLKSTRVQGMFSSTSASDSAYNTTQIPYDHTFLHLQKGETYKVRYRYLGNGDDSSPNTYPYDHVSPWGEKTFTVNRDSDSRTLYPIAPFSSDVVKDIFYVGNNTVYVIATSGSYNLKVYALDMATGTWTQKASLLNTVWTVWYRDTPLAYNPTHNRIESISTINGELGKIRAYDIATDTWSVIHDFSSTWPELACNKFMHSQWLGGMVILGGTFLGTEPYFYGYRMSNKAYLIKDSDGSVEALPDCPVYVNRYYTNLFELNNEIFLTGTPSNATNRISYVYKLTTDSSGNKVWIKLNDSNLVDHSSAPMGLHFTGAWCGDMKMTQSLEGRYDAITDSFEPAPYLAPNSAGDFGYSRKFAKVSDNEIVVVGSYSENYGEVISTDYSNRAGACKYTFSTRKDWNNNTYLCKNIGINKNLTAPVIVNYNTANKQIELLGTTDTLITRVIEVWDIGMTTLMDLIEETVAQQTTNNVFVTINNSTALQTGTPYKARVFYKTDLGNTPWSDILDFTY